MLKQSSTREQSWSRRCNADRGTKVKVVKGGGWGAGVLHACVKLQSSNGEKSHEKYIDTANKRAAFLML